MSKLPEGSKFCPACGSAVGESTSADAIRTNASEANTSAKADGMIDRAADDIGGGIDEALADLKDSFRRADKKIDTPYVTCGATTSGEETCGDTTSGETACYMNTSGSTASGANSGSNPPDGDDPDQVKQNVRKWITVENIEKFAAVSLLFPLFMLIASWVIGLIVSAAFGISSFFLADMILAIVNTIRTIVRFVFLICTIAGAVAMVYTVLCWSQKQNNWGWAACGTTIVGVVAAFGILLRWNSVVMFILSLLLAVYGADMVSRVLIQHRGVESESKPGVDFPAYSRAYEQYKAAHPYEMDPDAVLAGSPRASYFDGHGSTLLVYRILWFLLAIFTADIGNAWMQAKITRWEDSHTVIDGKRLKFNGTGGSLLGHWIIWGFLTGITLGIYGFFRHVTLLKWNMRHTYYEGERGAEDSAFDGSTFQYIGYEIIAILLGVITLGLDWESILRGDTAG